MPYLQTVETLRIIYIKLCVNKIIILFRLITINILYVTRLPPMMLIHGDKDKTVPLASSLHLGEALWNKGCRNASVSVLPGCSHTDICIDLMDPKRHWYDSVMNELLKGVEKCL